MNEDLFRAYGLEVPTTIAELERVADALLAKGIQPLACGARDKWPPLALYMYLTNRYGGVDAFQNAQGRRGRFDSESFVKAAEKYQEWVKKGYFGDKPLSEAYGDAQQLMATGKAGMHITGSWMCAQYSDPEFTDQTMGFYAFPILEGGMGKATDIMGQTDIGFAATHVAKGKKDAVVRFMKYAMDPEPCSASRAYLFRARRQVAFAPERNGFSRFRYCRNRPILVGSGPAADGDHAFERYNAEFLPARR